MKRLTAVLIAALLGLCLVKGQTAETLTNSSVIKMVKAGLADELVIDMIQSSPVSFDLSTHSLSGLSAQGVSPAVVRAMKAAAAKPAGAGIQDNSTTGRPEEKPASNINVPAAAVTAPSAGPLVGKMERSATVSAPGYTMPVKRLVEFYEGEFEDMADVITEWDKEIKIILLEAESINNRIRKTEQELREKKNKDSGGYDADILKLKKDLDGYRAEYKKVKEKMMKYGESIAKKMSEISSKEISAMGKEYNTVCQQVRSADADPAVEAKETDIIFSVRQINDVTSYYISPAAEMLSWYQNETESLQKIVNEWAVRIQDKINRDNELKSQLEPLQQKMQEYKANSKMYKNEIADLKKQIGTIEKERKKLAEEMENDSRELADLLKERGAVAQKAAKERFTDITENIGYYYQEKLNL